MQTRKSQPEGLAAAQHTLTCETCPDLMFAFEEHDLDSPARVLTLGGRKRRGHRRIAALGHAGERRRGGVVSSFRKPTLRPMKAVIYCRVSTREQTQNLSLATQRRECVRRAAWKWRVLLGAEAAAPATPIPSGSDHADGEFRTVEMSMLRVVDGEGETEVSPAGFEPTLSA